MAGIPTREAYVSLLEAIRAPMAEHARVWKDVKARTRKNGPAYAAARPWWDRMLAAWAALAAHLPEALPGPGSDPGTLEAWLRFCEADVPAFRAGYLKERVYKTFAAAPLDAAQRDRIRTLALRHAQAPHWRRALRALGLLAARLGDLAYLRALEALLERSAPGREQRKAGILLHQLLNHRPDLRPASTHRLQELSERLVRLDLEALEGEFRHRTADPPGED